MDNENRLGSPNRSQFSDVTENIPEFPYRGTEDFIFVSYRHEDANKVVKILSDMNQRGYRIWYDTAIHWGAHWRTSVVQRIKESKVFVVFLSKSCLKTNMCSKEITIADDLNKEIIPIMLDKVELPDDILLPLAGRNWLPAYKIKATKQIVDTLCAENGQIFKSCKSGSVIPPPPPPPAPWWKKIFPFIAAGMLIIAMAIGLNCFKGKDSPPEPAVSQVEMAPVNAADTPEPEILVQTSIIKKSAKSAASYLSFCASQSCPLPSLEGQSDCSAYDNAVAALALLSEDKNEQAAKILDALIAAIDSDGNMNTSFLSGFHCGSETGSRASVATALLRYFKQNGSYSYVNSAKAILDSIMKVTGTPEQYSEYTADNLWLYTAFSLLSDVTGDAGYSSAAEVCRNSIETSYLGFFGLKTKPAGECIPEIQAMAALALNDRRGLEYLLSQAVSTGKYQPVLQTSGIHSETACSLSLAFGKTDKEYDSVVAIETVMKLQLSNGSVSESDSSSVKNIDGSECHAVPRIASTAWYVMAVNAYNCFSVDVQS